MGPNLLFHLAAFGRNSPFHGAPLRAIASWWKDLGTITEFSPQVKQAIIDGVQKRQAIARSTNSTVSATPCCWNCLLPHKGEEAAEAAIAGGHGDNFNK